MTKKFIRAAEQAVAILLDELGEGYDIHHNNMQAGVLFFKGEQHQQYDLAGIKNGAGHRWDVKTFYARQSLLNGGWYFPIESYKHDGYMAYLTHRRQREPNFGFSYVYAMDARNCPSGPGIFIAEVDRLDRVKMDCQEKLYKGPGAYPPKKEEPYRYYNLAVSHFRKVDGIERFFYLRSEIEKQL